MKMQRKCINVPGSFRERSARTRGTVPAPGWINSPGVFGMSSDFMDSLSKAFPEAKTTRDTLPPFGGGGVSRGCCLAEAAREEKAQWVRDNLPKCSAVASAFREVFGRPVRMTYAEEAGHVIGKRAPEPSLAVSGDSLIAPRTRKKA